VPLPRRARLLATGTALALTAGLLFTSVPAAADPPEAPDPVPGRYIVTLTGSPIATYAGGVKGLRATRPAPGRKVDARSASAKAYRAYLEREQDKAAARVGAKAERHYALALNGFTTAMTADQAKRLQKAPGVLSVVKDTPRRLTDDKNPVDFLRLSGKDGVWASLGGVAKAGAGTVVGVLDSGYWPENPSFAGAALGTTPPTSTDPYRPYQVGDQIRMNKADGTTFTGVCQPGANAAARFAGTECNQKVIGARWFADAYRANTPDAEEDKFLSPRDDDGHGSHTASTAAGNAGITATADGRNFGKISGVAPAAKIAVYKVCYTQGCYNGDILAAIDAAITDGVDVINYSISGSDFLLDPTNVAFFSAAAAGIFVSASAGNAGPGASTLNHNAPWVTTVAASTVAPYAGTVVLGDGRRYAGISTTVTRTVGPAPLVRASLVRRAGVSVARSTLCHPNTLDPAKAAGKIVVCDRGVIARVDKSDEVKRAGGIGMVLVNLTESSSDADLHAVPTVHLNVPTSLTVREYATRAGATATLRPGNLTSTPIAYPQIAGFSSRGPSVGTGGDLLKPDISAPGVAVLAAFSPVPRGRNFDFLSGTSMSAPHVAGAAALYFGRHPRWSPMAVKSAMMTTAARVKNADGTLSRDYYAQGAGNVRPSAMFNPGLIFQSGPADWLSFVEGFGYEVADPEIEPIDPSDYNAPSIAIGRLVGTQTVTRRVTAVKPGLYRTSVAVPGVDATVRPSLLTFTRPGQTKTIKVTFTRRSAPLSKVAFGSLALQATGATVRLPIAVTPQAVDAPARVTGTGASGSLRIPVKAGFSGAFPITARGLAAGDVQQGEVAATAPNDLDVFPSTVPPGTRVARWGIESDDARADIDMQVYRVSDGALVGTSAGGTGVESVTLFDPQPGAYEVVVYPFSDPPGQGSTTYEYRGFTVGPDLPNFSVTPTNPTVRNGQSFTLTATWTGLDPARPYLGYIEYPGGDGTFVEIN